MRIIEIINLSLYYNEMLVKFHKGQQWLDNPNIPMAKKDAFLPKWKNLLAKMDLILTKLESIGITFNDLESLRCIEIPEQFKRKDIELLLEYSDTERQGMKLS